MPLAMPQRDEGASPVIGMIFVLAFSVVSILTTLYWGLPLVDEMKASTEYKAAGNQFSDLLNVVQDLTSGTAANTAKRWEPALSRGSVTIREDEDRWVYVLDQDNSTRLYLRRALGDGNSLEGILPTNVTWNGSDRIYVSAARIDGGQEYELAVRGDGAAMVTAGLIWGTGTWMNFTLVDSDGNAVNLDGNVIKVTFKKQTSALCSDATPLSCNYLNLATVWSMDMGNIHYSLPVGKYPRGIYATAGGLVQGVTDDLYISNNPATLSPSNADPTSPRFFVRATQITGSGSFAGDGKVQVVLSLDSTSALATELTGYSVKVYMEDNDRAEAWRAFYTDADNGYTFTEHLASGALFTDDDMNFIQYWPTVGTSFAFSLVHSEVVAGGA